jgi:hypothetical protein
VLTVKKLPRVDDNTRKSKKRNTIQPRISMISPHSERLVLATLSVIALSAPFAGADVSTPSDGKLANCAVNPIFGLPRGLYDRIVPAAGGARKRRDGRRALAAFPAHGRR